MDSNDIPAYRRDIDGLRGIAIALVLGYHAFPSLVRSGFIGVDVFFVISGYLISSIIFSDFYSRRIKRIFPALILVLMACLVAGQVLLLPPQFVQLAKHVAAGAFFVSNVALVREVDYFDIAAELKPLLHLWSLSIEEQFYVLWPLLLVIFRRLNINIFLAILTALGVSLVLNIVRVQAHSVTTFYSPITRGWELLMGCGLAYVHVYRSHAVLSIAGALRIRPSARLTNIGALAALGCIAIAVFLIDRKTVYPGWPAILPTLGTLLLIAVGEKTWINRNLLGHDVPVFVGLISYPLYLWHYPLLSFARILESEAPSPAQCIALLAASFILAWLTYVYVEKPIRNSANRKGKWLTAILLCLMIIVGSGGLFVYLRYRYQVWGDSSSQVTQQRIPDAAKQFLNVDYPYKTEFRNGTCLLSGQEKVFSSNCVDAEYYDGKLPLVLIWGDSHAAMYYRALEQLQSQYRFALAQFTSSSCPPLFDFDKDERPLCKPLNDFVREQIAKLKPAAVLLGHDWPQSINQDSLGQLKRTIAQLRKFGVKNIVLMGQVPRWKDFLPNIVAKYMIVNKLEAVPPRISYLREEGIDKLDAKMEQLAASLQLQYISPYKFLCNADGCLTTIGDGNKSITAFDTSHLTQLTASAIINSSFDKILPESLRTTQSSQ
jgi:peptidoglycan/LPS O-acetylase OafA/YrhL